jgi:hypothetical protein
MIHQLIEHQVFLGNGQANFYPSLNKRKQCNTNCLNPKTNLGINRRRGGGSGRPYQRVKLSTPPPPFALQRSVHLAVAHHRPQLARACPQPQLLLIEDWSSRGVRSRGVDLEITELVQIGAASTLVRADRGRRDLGCTCHVVWGGGEQVRRMCAGAGNRAEVHRGGESECDGRV